MEQKNKKNHKEHRDELAELFAETQRHLEAGKELAGKDGALQPLLKKLLEASLEGEIDAHLKSEGNSNRRNRKGNKTVKTQYGKVELDTPRDRQSSFEPILVPKRQRTLGASIDNKILGFYSMGMSYRDIGVHVEETYGIELSQGMLTAITDQIWEEVEAWRTRPLEELYPCLWLDAMVFKVREEGRIVKKAVYMALARTMEGQKELLGFYMGEAESAKFWMRVLSDLQERGVQDILICCIDNLSGFVEAVNAVYPETDVQLCLIHQLRNSLKFVSWQDRKEVAKDLRKVYSGVDEQAALVELDRFEAKWGKKYRPIVKSWRKNWTELATMFNYTAGIRTMIYTTNTIEGFHRQIRKVTETKGAFSSERALFTLLFLAQMRMSQSWTRVPKIWRKTKIELVINYEERIKRYYHY